MRPKIGSRARKRAAWLVASLVVPVSACASTARHEAATVPGSDRDATRVAELETRVRQLESDLQSAEQRRLAPAAVRIDAADTDESDESEVLAERGSDAGDPVVLTLHEDPPMAPLPVVTERLPVTQIPQVPIVSADASPVPATAIVSVPATFTEDTTDYRLGLSHLTARRFEDAIHSLSTYLRDHPGSERADDAMYWRATANYALRRYDVALVDYERVPRVAPRGEHAADAIYHSGLCHRRLGADAQARSAFARVRREYPDSAAAQLAAREETT